MSDVDKNE